MMRHAPAVLVTLITAFVVWGCKPTPAAVEAIRPVRAVKAGDFSAIGGRTFPGAAKATEAVEMSFRVAGPLITRPINVGDDVTKGQVLARIDPRDFEVNLRNVQAQLADAKALLALTEDEFERAKGAYERQAVSEIELARKRAERDRSRAQVEALEASVETAEDSLEYTNLRAPFDGTVVAIYVENFEDVRVRQAICRIVDDSSIEMIVDIPEHLISLAPQATGIRCTFDAFPGREIPARIKEIGAEASALTRTFPVTLIMDQPDDFKILAGMTGEAHGQPPAARAEMGVEIPITAVISADGEASYVWTIDETTMTVSKQPVTLGPFTTGGVLVEGLEPGTWVATAGAHYLQPDQRVRILGAGAPS